MRAPCAAVPLPPCDAGWPVVVYRGFAAMIWSGMELTICIASAFVESVDRQRHKFAISVLIPRLKRRSSWRYS